MITDNSVIFKRASAEIKTHILTAMFLCYIKKCNRQGLAEKKMTPWHVLILRNMKYFSAY